MQLELERIGPLRSVTVDFIERSNEIGRGTEARVTLTTLQIGTHRLRLANKVFYSLADVDLDIQLKVHQFLREHGFPTLPTFRADKTSENSIFMTDLTEGQKKICISSMDKVPKRKLKLSNPNEVRESLFEILKLAKKNGLLLHQDCFFLIIDKNTGEGKVLISDLSRLAYGLGAKTNDQSIAQFLLGINRFLEDASKIELPVSLSI